MKCSDSGKNVFDYSKLRARTVELGMTDRAVATAANMTPSTYSLKLNGKGEFSQEQICRICNFLMIGYGDIPKYFFAPMVQIN